MHERQHTSRQYEQPLRTLKDRNLERVGDHAANIAEMVIFLVEGRDVRHSQAAKA